MQGTHDQRSSVYCLVPPGTEEPAVRRLRQVLDSHRSPVEVVVERREQDRRRRLERRAGSGALADEACRRRIRNSDGRRVGDRRGEARPWVEGSALADRLSEQFGWIGLVQVVPAQDSQLAESLRLVVRFQSGDRSAFEEIYERSFTRIYSFLSSALADRHSAEDAAQEVFVRVFRALPAYEFRGIPFEAWLFRIARNQVIDELQRSHATVVEEPARLSRRHELAVAAHASDADVADDRDLLALVRRLPLPQRQVIVLRYVVDLDWRTIGLVLEKSPDAVRQLEQRAFRSLRQRLEAVGRSPSVKRLPLVRLQGLSPVTCQRRNALAFSAAA